MTPAPLRSASYVGTVMHHRLDAPGHRFVYPTGMYLLDLEELDEIDRRLWLFGRNRPRPVAFHDRDYLGPGRQPVLDKLHQLADAEGLAWPGGRVQLLTQCRVFGHVFNPASFYYLFDQGGQLAAVVVDVSNTFGERHPYVLRPELADRKASARGDGAVWHEKKVFHVSPFFSLDGSYRFEISPPGDRCTVDIDLAEEGQRRIETSLRLRRRPLTDGALASGLARFPLATVRIVAAIHWEALKLWRKGAPFHPKPPYDPEAARGGRW